MIKRLKLKFIFTIMFFVTVIITFLVVAVSVVPIQRDRREAKDFLERLVNMPQNGIVLKNEPLGKPSEPKPMERPLADFDKEKSIFSMANLVTAQVDFDLSVISWFSDRTDLYDGEYIADAAKKIISENKEFGTFDGQYYALKENSNGYFIALIDNSVSIDNSKRNLAIGMAAGFFSWTVLLILAVFLVNKMTKPVVEAFEKQKQFVSDAGHELKTPLAVISANANVLESENGENKWLSYIKTETKRMDTLVKNLMELAKIDDASNALNHSEFDISNAVLSAGLPFESLAFEKFTVINFEVQPNIVYKGNEEQIKQLVTILLGNAVKYGNERGVIKLSLSKERKKISLSVFNTGQGISNEEKAKIFDRFYRADKARSRENGSYGLGLAIAKAVVEEHGGKICVESKQGEWIRFDITL